MASQLNLLLSKIVKNDLQKDLKVTKLRLWSFKLNTLFIHLFLPYHLSLDPTCERRHHMVHFNPYIDFEKYLYDIFKNTKNLILYIPGIKFHWNFLTDRSKQTANMGKGVLKNKEIKAPRSLWMVPYSKKSHSGSHYQNS